MRVMYIAGNPAGEKPLQLEREINDLQDKLDRAVGADPIDFRAYPHLAIDDLVSRIAAFKPDVLHFAAHGEGEALVLSRSDGSDVILDGKALAALLKAVSISPQLIVINACSSNAMAAKLVANGAASFVIGTDAPITNDAARAMTAALYQRLAGASSIADAFTVAATQLQVETDGQVAISLYPEGAIEAARKVRLVDPFRIIAVIASIEESLENGHSKPDRRYLPEMQEIRFGVAGAPAAARRTVIFTDDEQLTNERTDGVDRWVVKKQPRQGEIWLDDPIALFRNIEWYAAITTTDRRIVSAAATTSEALERFYFGEQRRGDLPVEIEEAVRKTIDCLSNQQESYLRGNLKSHALPSIRRP